MLKFEINQVPQRFQMILTGVSSLESGESYTRFPI